MSRFRPGDKVEVKVLRNKNELTVEVELLNRSGNTEIVVAHDWSSLGATFQEVNERIKYRFNLSYGIEVAELETGGKMAKAGVKPQFIILKANKQTVASQKSFYEICNEIMSSNEEEKIVVLGGIYPNGAQAYYVLNLGE